MGVPEGDPLSARQEFCLCLDCWTVDYAVPDRNGVYQRDSAATNHDGHSVHVFGPPDQYPPPIRVLLTHLHAGLPITDGRIRMFTLACACHALQPTNGVPITWAADPTRPARPDTLPAAPNTAQEALFDAAGAT